MIQITTIPAFSDNYLWLLESEQECWIVDPGDAEPVKAILAQKGRELTGILITHHHPDHIGGVSELAKDSLQVIGPRLNQFALVNDPVDGGDTRIICGHKFQIFAVPGHTLNHMAYFTNPEHQAPLLFCGDTLFAGGCGRLFEGTATQMYRSLSAFSKLPPETLVYCAHEYTLANLAFAAYIEPENTAITKRIEEATRLRQIDTPTVPSNLQLEKDTNPFMRVAEKNVIQKAMDEQPEITNDPAEIFGVIRRLKDSF